MTPPVYLDNQSTTRVDPRVLDAMMPYLTDRYGNAASRSHDFGLTAAAAVSHARSQVAALIGAAPEEIIFTSGATESVNLAIKGVVEAAFQRRMGGVHVVTAATEHRAVLDTCARLERAGVSVTVLPVGPDGTVAPEDVAAAITPETVLVSIMWANNEIGTIAPVGAIARVCAERGVLFHSDATQAAGNVPVDVREIPVDLLSLSAHKMYGPKGAGALWVRRRTPPVALEAQLDGGGHERGLRSGTLNVPAIAGFGKAAALCAEEMAEGAPRVARLRDLLVDGIRRELPWIVENGNTRNRLPNNASITFPGLQADRLLRLMEGIAVSTGAACSSARPGPSHVLKAIGLTTALASATVRFSPGRMTTEEEIHRATAIVVRGVQRAHHQEPVEHHENTRAHSVAE